MTVRVEKQGPVTTVIHSRPAARNAMDPESAEALVAAFAAFDADPQASVAVFWGEGGAFCAGWDLKLASTLAGKDEPLAELNFPEDRGKPAPRGPMGPSRMQLSKPVIAAVAGPAVAGGFELALWCDIRILEQSAYFGVYCRRWGVPLIDGGTVRLPRLVGQGRAMEIILTGRKVPAEEALRIGACEQVVPDGTSREAAERMAAEQASGVAYESARQSALSASLIPLVNSLFAVGLVSLPGMMTGQILSGVSPLLATRYQIVVMCMLFGSSGLAAACYLFLSRPKDR